MDGEEPMSLLGNPIPTMVSVVLDKIKYMIVNMSKLQR